MRCSRFDSFKLSLPAYSIYKCRGKWQFFISICYYDNQLVGSNVFFYIKLRITTANSATNLGCSAIIPSGLCGKDEDCDR